MVTTISGSSISTANINLGGTFVSEKFASNNFVSDTFTSNTYFQNNSSTLHILQLEGKVTNETFTTSETILTGTHFRNTGLGFNVGSITWNSTNGRVTVPEAGVYNIVLTVYENGSSTTRVRVAINGSQQNVIHIGGTNGTRSFSFFHNLNANDYVEIQNDSSGSYNTNQLYLGTVHSFFTIRYLG